MADAGAIRAGKAQVEVGADTSPLAAALAKAQSMFSSFGSGILGVGVTLGVAGAAAVAALEVAGYAFAERGTHLLHQAEMVGASVEFMSSMSTGLEMLGGSADSAGQAFFRFNNKLAQAIGGSAEAQRAFQQLGIDANSLNNMTLDDRMDRISTAFQALGSHAEKSRIAMQLFGRGGREMIEALSRPGGLQAMRGELDGLGLVMSAETAQKAMELHQSFVLLKASAVSLMNAVLEPMVPIFKGIADGIAKATRDVRDWAKENMQWLDAVGDALSGGDLALAWDIITTTMKLAWADFTDSIMASIPALKRAIEGIGDAWNIAGQLAQRALNDPLRYVNPLGGAVAIIDTQAMLDEANQQRSDGEAKASEERDAERQQLQQQLDALRKKAAKKAPPRPDPYRPEADIITAHSIATRGTFNAATAFGLSGTTNPVVDAINKQATEQLEGLERLRQAVLDAGATFA